MNSKYQIACGYCGRCRARCSRHAGPPRAGETESLHHYRERSARPGTLAAYIPKAQAAAKAAGGTPGHISTGKVIAVTGEAPKRITASEWPSADQAQAYLKSPERAALDSERAKAFKTTRQFIVERPAN